MDLLGVLASSEDLDKSQVQFVLLGGEGQRYYQGNPQVCPLTWPPSSPR